MIISNERLYPFYCKEFLGNKKGWKGLGIVYAKDLKEAWDKAIEKWKKVDSVYDLYSIN